MSRQRQSVCRQRRRARPATTSQRQLRNLRHDSFGRHAVPPFRVQKASSSLWCGRGSIDMWACDQFPNVAAQRHSAWYPNHDAREDSDVAAAAEALRQRDPRDPSHDGDGNVMEGQRWGRRWR
ncbi:hypothetical protein EDB85DRAFT_1898063 [Lactarius pseudohatsudake]|nr:hypothetical protein EDB85DRAFT_1898063 [Lactarius pseudohatsudake]